MTLTLKGWLKDADMDPRLTKTTQPVRSFSSVRKTFLGRATSAAQAGNDYDIPNEPTVYDQGDIGSCVLNATCGAANIVLATEGLHTEMLSRLFLYWLCRTAMGTTDQDSGTYTHLAVDRIGTIGVCEESFWAYGDTNLYVPPPPECYPEASDNRAKAWFSLDSTSTQRLDDLEAAVRSNHPAIFGTDCSSVIQQYQAGQVLSIPDPNDIIGGHSMVVTGVRYLSGQRVWRIRNSWGASYGDNGHLLIDDAWMSWPSLTDVWVLTRMDALLF